MRTLGPFLFAAALLAQDSTKSAVPIRVARKVALVIGNSAYTNIATVPPASADADDMSASLRSLGFDEVVTRKNLTRDRLIEEITIFARTKVRQGDLALIYYSGHGGQVRDENYLLPVDFSPPSLDALVDTRAFRMSAVRDEIESSGAAVRVMIFDACRNALVIPAKSSTGLREMKGSAEGTMIAYASAHNQVARFDGSARNSFYTAALLEGLRKPGELKGLFETVQMKVFERTGRQQVPYLYGFLSGPVYLNGEPVVKVEVPVRTGQVDLALEAWNGIKDSRDPAVFEKFARMFPGHELAKVALLRVEALGPSTRVETGRTRPEPASPRQSVSFRHPLDNTMLDFNSAPETSLTPAVRQFRESGRNPLNGNASAIAEGKVAYERWCAGCHLKNGTGRIGSNLIDAQYNYPRVANDIGTFEVIYAGGSGAMQPFAERVSNDTILRIIAYLNSIRP